MRGIDRVVVLALLLSGRAVVSSMTILADPPTTIQGLCDSITTVSWWDFDTRGCREEETLCYCANGGAPSNSNDADTFLRNHPSGYSDCRRLDLQSNKMNVIAKTDNLAGVYVNPKTSVSRAEFSDGVSLKFRIVSRSGPQAAGDFTIPSRRIGEPPNSTLCTVSGRRLIVGSMGSLEKVALAGVEVEGGVIGR